MTGRPRTVEDGAIFHVVSEVISREGPNGLTLAAIGKGVGISAPGLAQRFGSKRGLLLAFAGRGSGVVGAAFDTATTSNRSPTRALLAALTSLAEPIRTRESLANNLAFLQMDLVDPDFRAHAVEQSRELRRLISSLLDHAVANGELTSDTNVPALSKTVYTTYNGALITWAIDGRGALGSWLRASLEAVIEPHTIVSRTVS